jgi:hypothetical protein
MTCIGLGFVLRVHQYVSNKIRIWWVVIQKVDQCSSCVFTLDRGVNTFSPEGRLFQGTVTTLNVPKPISVQLQSNMPSKQSKYSTSSTHIPLIPNLYIARFNHSRHSYSRGLHLGRRKTRPIPTPRIRFHRENNGNRCPSRMRHVRSHSRRTHHDRPRPRHRSEPQFHLRRKDQSGERHPGRL